MDACERLTPGMVFAVELFEILLVDMGLDLGRADYRVAEHRLDEPEVGTSPQEST